MSSISVTEPNPRFSETVHFTYTYDRELKAGQALLARVDCTQNGARVYAELISIARGDDDFTLGPTPRWQGGAAQGELKLILSTGGRFRTVATDEFNVLP